MRLRSVITVSWRNISKKKATLSRPWRYSRTHGTCVHTLKKNFSRCFVRSHLGVLPERCPADCMGSEYWKNLPPLTSTSVIMRSFQVRGVRSNHLDRRQRRGGKHAFLENMRQARGRAQAAASTDPHVVNVASRYKNGVAIGPRPDSCGEGVPERAPAQGAEVVALGLGEEADVGRVRAGWAYFFF